MRLVIEISKETTKKIHQLVTKGKFNSLFEFVQIAINNQLLLEEAELPFDIKHSDLQDQIAQTQGFVIERPVGADLLQLSSRDYESIGVLPLPKQEMLEEGPIWGQYNRIFPVKIIVRILTNLMFYSKGPINLQEFGNEASEVARQLGHRLRDIDKSTRRGTGQKLSTALPVGSDPWKSKSRFINQFIGNLDRKSRLFGASPKLGFINIIDPNFPRIGLTKEGLDFALFKNPILENISFESGPFSQKEIDYYIKHVKQFLPTEMNLMKLVLISIKRGDNSPKRINANIANFRKTWAKGQVQTIRGGLIGRLSELGLIVIVRSGRDISYNLTELGQRKLSTMGG